MFLTLHCRFLPKERPLSENTEPIAHRILETFQADFYGPFSERTAAKVIMEVERISR